MKLYLGLALLSAIFMASSGVIARYSQMAAAELTFYRLGVGALCVFFWLLGTGQVRQLWHRPNRQMLQNGLLLASFMLGFLQAIQSIPLANAIMMVYLAPPCTALVAHFYFAERLNLSSGLLIMLALLGFAMLQQFQFDVSADPAQLRGYGWALLSLLAYSAFLLCNRQPTAGTSLGQRTFYQLLFGACCVLPLLTNSKFTSGHRLALGRAGRIIPRLSGHWLCAGGAGTSAKPGLWHFSLCGACRSDPGWLVAVPGTTDAFAISGHQSDPVGRYPAGVAGRPTSGRA